MTRTARPLHRLVLLGIFAAALAVAGCGRKGALDAPPGGAAVSTAGQSQLDPAQTAPQASQGNTLIDHGSQGGLPRVRGEDKRIPLDVLLN